MCIIPHFLEEIFLSQLVRYHYYIGNMVSWECKILVEILYETGRTLFFDNFCFGVSGLSGQSGLSGRIWFAAQTNHIVFEAQLEFF